MKIHAVIILVLCSILTLSCTSPENDGAAMGMRVNECNKEYLEVLQKLDANFGKTISYNSRKAAKSAYFAAKTEANTNYRIALDEIYQTASGKKKSYNNHKSQSEFNAAFVNAIDSDLTNSVRAATADTKLPPTVLAYIKSIIPPKPSINQIQRDLIGHSLSEGVDNGYYPSYWRWTIKEGEISGFNIEQVLTNTNKEYCIIATMRITSMVGKTYNAKVRISYVLPETDDWTMEFVNSEGMHIIKSGKYDDLVKLEKDEYFYYIYNNSDISLEVGGISLYWVTPSRQDWGRYSEIIGPHSSKKFYDETYIDYVERP